MTAMLKLVDAPSEVEDTDISAPAIEITPEMIEAGAYEVECATGGADLGGYFSAPVWAERVYRAMAHAAPKARNGCP